MLDERVVDDDEVRHGAGGPIGGGSGRAAAAHARGGAPRWQRDDATTNPEAERREALRTRLKVCCITDPDALALAVRHGADALGLVGPMPSGTGIVALETARMLASLAPPGVASFLLTSAVTPEALVEEARAVQPTVLQIVDRVPVEAYRALREALPALKLVQVVHVEREAETLDEAGEAALHVDAVLLDSGNRSGPVALLGGTGLVHDWRISRRVVEALDKPVILAGGLNPSNVAEAVRVVRPYAVDLCTGLRTDDRLDEAKLAAFVAALR